ncbi:hypothetical protein ANCCAN_09661 [Ancylostoma caninum]|uniref:C-type lectin domain-containing protein n=1 Tax=Ancylostoma caninum TaxID=29170 RepID=A0A368GN26_ANCCA|nr:hypothetical protein ANCCAN_09661 [Ancylostoma caninum]
MWVIAAVVLVVLPLVGANVEARRCTMWKNGFGKCYAVRCCASEVYCGNHSFEEAENVCRANQAHLASIRSKDENRFLVRKYPSL